MVAVLRPDETPSGCCPHGQRPRASEYSLESFAQRVAAQAGQFHVAGAALLAFCKSGALASALLMITHCRQ
jgi:hypothetical protein